MNFKLQPRVINALKSVLSNRWKVTCESLLMFKPPHFTSTPQLLETSYLTWFDVLCKAMSENNKIKLTKRGIKGID